HVHGRAVFIAAIMAQAVITVLFFLNLNGVIEIGYLWFNLIAPAILILIALVLDAVLPAPPHNDRA
ncbi:MAG: hypothetical protein AAGB22_03045, partial [Bacteroidota bacterium]